MTGVIFLTGGTGQVGMAVRALADPAKWRVLAPLRAEFDLSRPETLAAAFPDADIDVIINAGACTAVDRAEEEADLAMRVNAEAPGALAAIAARRNIPILHVSTDYVFDGSGDKPWRETDGTGPLGVYGRSKLAGEQAVLDTNACGAILRTSWVYSDTGHNFVKTMIRLAGERDHLKIVNDQIGAPTSAYDIAACLLRIADAEPGAGGPAPVYHFTAGGEVSWYDVACAVFENMAARYLKTPEVSPIPTSEYPTPAQRPLNSRLDCARIRSDLGILQPDWRESLNNVLERLLDEDRRKSA